MRIPNLKLLLPALAISVYATAAAAQTMVYPSAQTATPYPPPDLLHPMQEKIQILPQSAENQAPQQLKTIESTPDELIVSGPGKIEFEARADIWETIGSIKSDVEVELTLLPVGSEQPAHLRVSLPMSNALPDAEEPSYRWAVGVT